MQIYQLRENYDTCDHFVVIMINEQYEYINYYEHVMNDRVYQEENSFNFSDLRYDVRICNEVQYKHFERNQGKSKVKLLTQNLIIYNRIYPQNVASVSKSFVFPYCCGGCSASFWTIGEPSSVSAAAENARKANVAKRNA